MAPTSESEKKMLLSFSSPRSGGLVPGRAPGSTSGRKIKNGKNSIKGKSKECDSQYTGSEYVMKGKLNKLHLLLICVGERGCCFEQHLRKEGRCLLS